MGAKTNWKSRQKARIMAQSDSVQRGNCVSFAGGLQASLREKMPTATMGNTSETATKSQKKFAYTAKGVPSKRKLRTEKRKFSGR